MTEGPANVAPGLAARYASAFAAYLARVRSAVLVAVSGALLLSVKLLSGSAWLGGAAR